VSWVGYVFKRGDRGTDFFDQLVFVKFLHLYSGKGEGMFLPYQPFLKTPGRLK